VLTAGPLEFFKQAFREVVIFAEYSVNALPID